MRRFSSMKYAVAETRRILRDRFARYLPVIQYAAAAPRGGNLIPDEQLLELLLGLDIVCKSDIDSSRAAYDAASPPGIGEPSLDEVIAAGWIRVVWGRIAAPFEIDQRARARPDDNLTALSALLKERFGETYAFSGAAYGDVGLESLAAAIERGDASPGALRSQSPEWVAARLWDRALPASSHGGALRVWVDRWRLLGWPLLVAHETWSEAAANAFREAALSVLTAEFNPIFKEHLEREGASFSEEERVPMSNDADDDPLKAAMLDIIEKRNAAIETHTALRRSPGFAAASKRSETLVADYALGLNAVSLMSTRSSAYGEVLLSLRMLDLLLESAISTLSLIREGMLNPARREMRFLLEASIKAWWCDSVEPSGGVQRKIDFLDDLGSARFREVVDTLHPRLLDELTRGNLIQIITNLYAQLSTHVHASTGGIGVNLRRFRRGEYVGFEAIADVSRVNELFTQVLDISLAAVFESFDPELLGDVFVQVFDDNPKWTFHKTPLVKSISAHYDYKVERQRRPPCLSSSEK